MSEEEQQKKPIPAVEFHFGKSTFFRVVYADGAVGAVAPRNGMLRMSFYNERIPIPQKTVHALTLKDPEIGRYDMGSEISEAREAKTGIFREVEVDVVMTLQAVKDLHKWLGEKIPELEKHQRQ